MICKAGGILRTIPWPQVPAESFAPAIPKGQIKFLLSERSSNEHAASSHTRFKSSISRFSRPQMQGTVIGAKGGTWWRR
jgi:hypothetical protein